MQDPCTGCCNRSRLTGRRPQNDPAANITCVSHIRSQDVGNDLVQHRASAALRQGTQRNYRRSAHGWSRSSRLSRVGTYS
jgi:hypothetical protein